jgi:hypothetical protein
MKDYNFKTKRLETRSIEKKQIRKVSIRKNRRPNSTKILKTNITRYNCDLNMYLRKIVTDLMYDAKKHIVSVFKE